MKPFRSAVIGTGEIGRFHVKELINCKKKGVPVDVYAVVARTKREVDFGVPKADTKNIRLLYELSPEQIAERLREEKVSLVINSAPDSIAHEISEALLRQKIPYVVAEKAGAPTSKRMEELAAIAKENKVQLGIKYQKVHHPSFAALLKEAKGFQKAILEGGGRAQLDIRASDSDEPVYKQGRQSQMGNQGGHLFSLAAAFEAAVGAKFTRFDGMTDKGRNWKDSSFACATLSNDDCSVICRLSMARTSDVARDSMSLRLFEASVNPEAKHLWTFTKEAINEGEGSWSTMWDEAFRIQMHGICTAVASSEPLGNNVIGGDEAANVLRLVEACEASANQKFR